MREGEARHHAGGPPRIPRLDRRGASRSSVLSWRGVLGVLLEPYTLTGRRQTPLRCGTNRRLLRADGYAPTHGGLPTSAGGRPVSSTR